MKIDIITTSKCTNGCQACYAPDNDTSMDTQTRHKSIAFIRELMEETPQDIIISLTGGEPTMSTMAIENLFEQFKDDERVSFEVVTTGYKVPRRSLNMLTSSGKCKVKMYYDGQTVTETYRMHGTSQQKQFIDAVRQAGLELEVLSFVPFGMSHTMSDTYDELKSLEIKFAPRFSNIGTNVMYDSIDVKAMEEITTEEISRAMQGLDSMFAPFVDQVTPCGAGAERISIGMDGLVGKCHGCHWSKEQADHSLGTVFDDSTVMKAVGALAYHSALPQACDACGATYCVSCNVAAYDNTRGTNYAKRWCDVSSQPSCAMYIALSEYKRKYDHVLSLYDEKDG